MRASFVHWRCTMKLTTNKILLIFGVLALMLLACIPLTLFAAPFIVSGRAEEANSLPTIQAQFTSTPVPTLPAPLPTVLPPTVVVVTPTNVPIPTATQVTYCDWAAFVKDVTIPDGSKIAAGEPFVKTWRLKNRGTCSWSPDYRLVFNSGDQMGETSAVRLPAYVAPGQSVDVSVTLTAPADSGHYTGYWMLRNPSGEMFGTGDKPTTPVYVDIYSKAVLPHGTVTGSICYPSEFNPALIVYFERADHADVIQFQVPENTPTFSFLLPNGTYYVRAKAPDYNLEGAFVNPDLTMKSFVIKGGQTTTGISICDWGTAPHSWGQ